MKRKLLTLLSTAILICSLAVPVFASTNVPIKGTPPSGVGSPLGTLTQGQAMIEPMAAPPVTTVTGITSTYNGYIWRGWKVVGGPGGTVTLGNIVTVANSYSSTLSIAAQNVTAAVGFNVTYTSSMTASYSHPITNGMYGFIGYDDWYNVKTFTTAQRNYLGEIIATGTGYANQWYMFGYNYGETYSSGTQPPSPH